MMSSERRSYSDHAFLRIPLKEIKTVRSGKICYPESWWAVTPDDQVLFFTGQNYFTPQCNNNKSITERIMPTGCRAEWIEMAFIPTDDRHAGWCLRKMEEEESRD
jgi:hypothetical protein